MPLEKYEDFLNVKDLIDYLAVRGWKTSGRKVELVARAFTTFELKLEIVAYSEDQLKRLKYEYGELLKRLDIPDPNGIEIEKRLDNLTLWPVITMGNIFAFILHKKDFNTDYIDKYKDQKTYSYFDSGFVGGPVFIYEPKSKQRGNIVFLYSEVSASQAVHEYKQLCIVVKKIDESGSNILSAWCSCMAGSFETCNHVIATLYKIEYAHRKGLCNLACTETAC